MTPTKTLFDAKNHMDFIRLLHYCAKPERFEQGEPRFWDDPHIAQQMLQTHLNPDTDLASRKPETIDRTVNCIVERLGLQAGDSLLDLGCGPGLYCQRFNAAGLNVTGVDLSENSLRYAREHDPKTTYLHQNYTSLDVEGPFDAITLIFGDFCVLNDADQVTLLEKVYKLLKPGGHFVFDVTTQTLHGKASRQPGYNVHPIGGFWKPGPHITLTQVYDYPETDTTLDQFVVIEADGTISVFRNWFHYFSPESITALVESVGFQVGRLYADLTGAPLVPNSDWIAVVAQKPA